MAKKKKTQTIGTISGMEILRQTRPPQDIPFRTGSYTDKRKKRKLPKYISRSKRCN